MGKNGKRDKPYKHFQADYFDWHYAFGGHYLKQNDKIATNRVFRRVGKESIKSGLQEYESERDDEMEDGILIGQSCKITNT